MSGRITLALLALLTLSAGLGLKDPWPADEPRFALVAREMVATGNWLIPHRAGELYADKPPVFMWSIAAGFLLTHSLRIAHLLPSLLAGLATLWLVYDLGRRLWNPRTGFHAALILLLTFQFTSQARRAQIDGMLCLWTTLGLYGLLRHLLLGPAWRWYATGFFSMGLGVITKGVGFLPMLSLFVYGWLRWQRWPTPVLGDSRTSLLWAAGPLAFLLAIGLWGIPMLVEVAASGDPALGAYRDNILWQQTAERYAAPKGHFEPAWFFLREIPLNWAPITLFLPWLLPLWWQRLRQRDSAVALLLGWVALVVAFFSFSSGKRDQYILPALPALALATGAVMDELWRRRAAQYLGFAITAGAALALLGASVYAASGALPPSDKLTGSPAALLALAGCGGLLVVGFARPARGLFALAGCIALGWQIYGWGAYPLMNDSPSGRQLMRAVGVRLQPHQDLAILRWREQLLLQADRPVMIFRPGPSAAPNDAAEQAASWLLQDENRRLLLPDNARARCFREDRLRPVTHWRDNDWYLADHEAVSEACAAPRRIDPWRRPW